jgi:hypothetical protein
MLLNAQASHSFGRDEVGHGDRPRCDDRWMIGELGVQLSHVSVLIFGQQSNNALNIQCVVTTEVLVIVVFTVSIGAEFH